MDIKTALVVDDSKVAYLTLSKMLAKRAIASEGASSGEEALEYLKHKRPDVIFMDVVMPGIDGYETAHSVISNPRTAAIPVVMCSSKDSDEDRNRAFSEGARGFIVKPATEEGLNQVLQEIQQLPATSGAVEEPAVAQELAANESLDESAAPRPSVSAPAIAEATLTIRLQSLAEHYARATAERVAAQVADTVASRVATEAADRVTKDMLRAASEQMGQQIGSEVRPLAERVATEIAESVANTMAATTSHVVAAKIAEDVVRESVERLSKEIVTGVAQRVVMEAASIRMEEIKKDLQEYSIQFLRDHSAKFLTSDVVKDTVAKLVENAATDVAEAVAKRVAKPIAEEAAQKTARRVAEETVSYIAGKAARSASESSQRAIIGLGMVVLGLVIYEVFTAFKGFLF